MRFNDARETIRTAASIVLRSRVSPPPYRVHRGSGGEGATSRDPRRAARLEAAGPTPDVQAKVAQDTIPGRRFWAIASCATHFDTAPGLAPGLTRNLAQTPLRAESYATGVHARAASSGAIEAAVVRRGSRERPAGRAGTSAHEGPRRGTITRPESAEPSAGGEVREGLRGAPLRVVGEAGRRRPTRVNRSEMPARPQTGVNTLKRLTAEELRSINPGHAGRQTTRLSGAGLETRPADLSAWRCENCGSPRWECPCLPDNLSYDRAPHLSRTT